MRKLTISAEGRSISDLELAVEESLRRIRDGFTSGTDRNDTGSFHFEIDGDEEPAGEQS